MKTKILLLIISILQTTILLAVPLTWELKDYNHENTTPLSNLRTNGEFVTYFIQRVKSNLPHLQAKYETWGVSDKYLNSFSRDTFSNPNLRYFYDYCITKGNKILAVADSGYIYETDDFGKNWTTRRVLDSSEFITAIAFRDENYGVFFGINEDLYHGLYYTTDGGENWEKSDNLIDDSDNDIFIRHLQFEQDTIFALFFKYSEKKFYSVFSFNSGLTWEEPNPIDVNITHIKPGLTPGLNDFFFEGSKIWGALYGLTGNGQEEISAIIHSVDFGKKWIVLRDTVGTNTGIPIHGCAFFDDLQVGLAVDGINTYYTNDGGYNWVTLENVPFSYIIKLNGDLVCTAEDRAGIFRQTTSVQDGSEKPNEYELKYLPLSERLEISSVDKPIESVAIYDLTGKIIFNSKFNTGTFAEVDLSGINVNNVLLIQINVGGACYLDKILKER